MKIFLREIYPYLPNKYSDFVLNLYNYYTKQKTSFNYCNDLKMLTDNPEFIANYLRVLSSKKRIRCILGSRELMILVNNVYNKRYSEISTEVNSLLSDVLYERLMENTQRIFSGESSEYLEPVINTFVKGGKFRIPGMMGGNFETGMLIKMTFDGISEESSSLQFNLLNPSNQKIVGTIHITRDNFQINIGILKVKKKIFLTPENFFSIIVDTNNSDNRLFESKKV